MRSEPSHRAEQVNEMLYGERAEVLEVNEDNWARIRCEWDGYEGWCRFGQLTMTNRKEYRKPAKAVAASHTDRILFEQGDQWVPMGSDLFGFKKSLVNFKGDTGKYKGKKLALKKMVLDAVSLEKAAMAYLHAPYLWGGRSRAGIDCSGLTQMAFKMCGMAIPRDASQQAKEGTGVDFLQHAQCGDLAFFDNSEGKIVHVGILLDNHTIIHATETSGRVVIDRIDQEGIISVKLKKRTHHLRFVKRMF